MALDDLGPARVCIALADLGELRADHRHQAVRVAKDVRKGPDVVEELPVLREDLVLFQRGQPVQPQVEDRLGLDRREAIAVTGQPELAADVGRLRRDLAGAGQHLRHPTRGPDPCHQRIARGRRRCRSLDHGDHVIDAREGHRLALEHVGALAGLAQIEDRAACHDLAAVAQECLQHLAQREQARPSVAQRNHVDAEYGLERRLGEQVVQHHVRQLAAAQFDDDAHAVLVGLVPQLADALDLLVAHQLSDLLDQPGLVHLVRQLGDDDGLAAPVVDLLRWWCARARGSARVHGRRPRIRRASH